MNDPIDYDSPLGISKREWTKVLGANLALLLLAYAVALIFTLCGSDLFLLNFHSEDLQRIEETLWSWKIYPIIQIAFSCVETWIMGSYVSRKPIKWYWIVGYFAIRVVSNIVFTQTIGYYPSFIPFVMGLAFITIYGFIVCKSEKKWKIIARVAIAFAVSLILNEAISILRTKVWELWHLDYNNSSFFALSVEYDLALALALGLLTLVIKWEKGEKEQCLVNPAASGSSPITKNSSRNNSKIAKTNLPPQIKKRLRWLKIKVYAIQTTALVVIAALPWFAGRPVEFALVYASFCFTRLILGFSHSLHFKSELMCVTIGALCFWALTFLTPSADVSIILSLCYGAGLALGFRLYWELHDLMMYKKAAKTDRYAMLYTAFKGNVDPRRINGVMRAKGYSEKNDIRMVQMYMQREKVDYIAEVLSFAKITIEKRLTEIAKDLYAKR